MVLHICTGYLQRQVRGNDHHFHSTRRRFSSEGERETLRSEVNRSDGPFFAMHSCREGLWAIDTTCTYGKCRRKTKQKYKLALVQNFELSLQNQANNRTQIWKPVSLTPEERLLSILPPPYIIVHTSLQVLHCPKTSPSDYPPPEDQVFTSPNSAYLELSRC